MSIKIDHLIKSYDGSADFLQWIQKVECVANLQNVSDLSSFVPLFLEGEAFMIYQELSVEDKKDVGKIKKALENAFCVTSGEAYSQFVARHLKTGESVDVYVADLKRLLSLAQISYNENIIKEQFLKGLPSKIRQEVGSAVGEDGKDVSLVKVIARTKRVKLSQNEKVTESRIFSLAKSIQDQVQVDDPVKGRWVVRPVEDCCLYVDASDLAIGSVLTVQGSAIEDACWLRKPNDARHINVAELEAVIKGLNMVIKWQIRTLTVFSDSKVVISWLQTVISNSHRIKVGG